jgi:HK97 family phage major capsid protein
MSVIALKRKIGALSDKRKELAETIAKENREFTTEEQEQFSGAKDEIESLKGRIAMLEEVEKEQAELSRPLAGNGTEGRVEVGEPEWLKDKNKGWSRLGAFLDDLRADEVGNKPSKNYTRWKETVLSPDFQQKHFAAGTGGMIAGVASEGGALIPGGFVGTLLEKPMKDNPILNGLQTIPINAGNTIEIPYINETSRASGSRQGGIRVYRNAELAAMTQSKTALGGLKLTATALTGMAFVSNDLLKFSAISVEALIQRLFQREFTFRIQDEVINGNGGEEFNGILGANCLVSVAKETGQAADTINYTNIVKMWARRHVASGPYVWAVNQDTFPQLSMLSMPIGTGGVPVFMPAGGMGGMPFATIFGAPVVETEQSATLGDKGDIILMAPSEFIHAPVPGIDSDMSIHLKFDYRQTAFRFAMFNAGSPWWNGTLTPYKGATNTQSPFVTLDARA